MTAPPPPTPVPAAGADVPTPALVVDAAVLDANIAAMQALADAGGVALRPHVKGHRSPEIAARQVAAGAVGVAAATVGEVATMVRAGIGDVLLTTNIAPQRADELADVGRHGGLTVVAHEVALVDDLDVAAVAHRARLRVLVDVDVGQRRGGAATPAAAVAVAVRVREAPNLEFAGVQGYDGHLQGIADAGARAAGHAEAMSRLDDVLAALEERGLSCATVSTGGTATARLAAAHPSMTEIQPGSYALMDATYAEIEGVAFAQAAHVLTTVTALVGPGEVIVDAGTRAVSTDLGPARVADLDATWESAGDEHGRLRGAVDHLRTGDVVGLVPSHTDTTVVLHGAVVLA